MNTYNKEEVMKAFDERYSDSEVDGHLMKSALRENHRQFLSTALDAAYKAGKETQIEHCAKPECPECNITAYKAGVGDCIAIVEECSDFADSGHTLKMRIINQIQALK